MLVFLFTYYIFRLNTKTKPHTMHILFTDTHPRRIAEATRTNHLQPALDDVIRSLQESARLYDRHAKIALQYKYEPEDHQYDLADWACLSRSNWMHLSNVASMLLFEIAFRIDRRRRKKKNASIIGGERSFEDYKKAVVWSATNVPMNLPENGFFNVPFFLDPFYSRNVNDSVKAYRLAYADIGLDDGDLDERSVPDWMALSVQHLIGMRKTKLEKVHGWESEDEDGDKS